MRLYEYEAKEIASRYGIPIPRGKIARSPDEAFAIASELGSSVVKAQVLVGGRGLAGGVKIASTPGEAREIASKLIGSNIRGVKVDFVLIEEKICVSKELYLSLTVDRAARKPVFLASEMGGVEIEELARKYPSRIQRIYVDPEVGYSEYMSRVVLSALKLPWGIIGELSSIMRAMYKIMVDYDAELVEFNPLAYTCEGKLIALDAKLIIDDNSLHRHPDLQERYGRELSGFERKARELGFSYVELDGDIGVISNGAGLTMATMDSIFFYGGSPANFLDIGGGASRDKVKEAVKLMLSHPRPRVLLVNIFGGITRCDEVALGIVEALKEASSRKPIVVRMLGTNEEEGRKILMEHGIDVYIEMDKAVQAAVDLSRRG
ncbi:MAG: ADP-forming succinate--CoA ligase subunit beta [Desulfurococcaceae archaeon]